MSKLMILFSNPITLNFKDNKLNKLYLKRSENSQSMILNKIFLLLNWILSIATTIFSFTQINGLDKFNFKIILIINSALNLICFVLLLFMKKRVTGLFLGMFQNFSLCLNFYFFSVVTLNTNDLIFCLIFPIFTVISGLFIYNVENRPLSISISILIFNIISFKWTIDLNKIDVIQNTYLIMSISEFLISYIFHILLKVNFSRMIKEKRTTENLKNLIKLCEINYLKVKNHTLEINQSFLNNEIKYFPEIENLINPSNQMLQNNTSRNLSLESIMIFNPNAQDFSDKKLNLSHEMLVDFFYYLIFSMTSIEEKCSEDLQLYTIHKMLKNNREMTETQKKTYFIRNFNKILTEKAFSEEFVKIGTKITTISHTNYLFHIYMFSYSQSIEDVEILIQESTEKISKDELTHIVKKKNLFFSKISHDLKNSLMMVKSLSQNLRQKLKKLDSEKDNKEYIKKCRTLSKDIYKFSEFLKDLSMDYNKIGNSESEVFELKISKIKIAEIAKFTENITSIWINLKQKFNLKFNLNIPSYLLEKTVETDIIRLKQIILNLVSNSVKFSFEGFITLSIHEDYLDNESYLKISISDEGRGIDKEKRNIIFDPYKKNLSIFDIEGNNEGAGLGLSIVSFLTAKLGKRIDVDLERKKGTNFFFYIRFDQGRNMKRNRSNQEIFFHKSTKTITKTIESCKPSYLSSQKTLINQRKSINLNSPENSKKIIIENELMNSSSSNDSKGSEDSNNLTHVTNILKFIDKAGIEKLKPKGKKKKTVHLPFLSPVKNHFTNRKVSFWTKNYHGEKLNFNINTKSVNINNYSIQDQRKKRCLSLFDIKIPISPSTLAILKDEIGPKNDDNESEEELEYELNRTKNMKTERFPSPINKRKNPIVHRASLFTDNNAVLKFRNENLGNFRLNQKVLTNKNIKLVNFRKSILEKEKIEEKICIIVDDDKLVRDSMRETLSHYSRARKIPISIIESNDGVEALFEYYKLDKFGKKVSLIISDESMVYLNGSKLAFILKNYYNNFNSNLTKYILVSADNPENHRQRVKNVDKILEKADNTALYICLDEYLCGKL